ncbi:MAG: peptidylprolyl isomerase [Spirochaetaceae bacterium]|jgi:hypothetical protein|nr:peptidylprolyl isomerase [Spirochaetaceae bacterium]
MAEKKSEKHGKSTEISGGSDIERRFKQHPLIFIGTVLVLIIVIIAFVLVPAIVPGEGLTVSRLEFGSWDGKPIAYSVGGFFARVRERNSQEYGMNDYQAWRSAFDMTVERTAILDIMDGSGYTPSKPFVDKKVAELPYFQENGRFSAVKYNKVDAAARIKLWQDMRNDSIVNIYHDDVSTIKTAEAETEFIGRMALPQRKFSMAAFPYTSYPDSEVASYASRNVDMFKTVHLSRITVTGGRREAQVVLSKIQSGEITFEDAARTQSGDDYADRGGDTGVRTAFELSTEIPDEEQWQTVINLPKDEVAGPFELSSGWVIFRANEMSRPPNLQDSEVLGKARDFLMDSERGVIEDWLITQAENFAREARSTSFTRAAAGASLEVHEFGALPVNYGDSPLFASLSSFQAPGLRDAVSDENFWRTAFSTPVGEPSRPIVLSGSESNIVVLYPDEEITDESDAAENSKTTFSSWWAENETQRSVAASILASDKFNDNFDNTYFRLFFN